MQEQINHFLRGVSLKNSEQKARRMVADRFEGVLTSNRRYVKIGRDEYMIRKDPDNPNGWEVRRMSWEHGNDWKFFKEY